MKRPYGFPDRNQGDLVRALRKVGALVQITTGVGLGFPDLVVLFRRQLYLLEVKPSGVKPSAARLNANELQWHRDWLAAGAPVHVVTTPEEALAAIGAIRV